MKYKIVRTISCINILNFAILVKSLPIDVEKQATVETISINNVEPNVITVNGLPYKGKTNLINIKIKLHLV